MARCFATAAMAAAAISVVGCATPAQPAGPTSMVLRVADYDAFLDETLSMLRRYDFAPEFVDRANGVVVTTPTTSAQFFELWRVDSRGLYNILESSLHTTRRVISLQIEPLDGEIPPPSFEPLPVEPSATASATADEASETETAANETPDEATPTTAPATPEYLRHRPGTSSTGVASVSPLAPSTQPVADDAPRYRVVVRVEKSRYSAPDRQVTTASGALGIYSERLPTTEGLRPRGYYVQWIPLGRDGEFEAFLLDEISKVNPDSQRVPDPTAPVAAPVEAARG